MAEAVNTTKPQWLSSTPKVKAKMSPQNLRYAYVLPNSNANGAGGTNSNSNEGSDIYSQWGYDRYSPTLKNVPEMSTLMDGFNYDESRIRGLFDKATKTEYAAKRQANAQGQNQFAGNVAGYINTLSDTMRQSLNQAVATGGSRGLIAAQAMQAARDASSQATADASKLSQDAINLDYEEAAAYAKNAADAEALAAQRQQAAMQLASQIYGYDVQHAVGLASGMAGYFGDKDYGLSKGYLDLEGVKYNADKNYESNIKAATLSAARDFVMNRNISEGQFGVIEQMFGLDPGTLKEAPMNTYSGGGGSYYGGTVTGSDADVYDAYAALQKALVAGDEQAYALAYHKLYEKGLEAGELDFKGKRGELWNYAQNHTLEEFKKKYKEIVGTTENAESYYKTWSKGAWSKSDPSSYSSGDYARVQQGTDKLGRIGGYY